MANEEDTLKQYMPTLVRDFMRALIIGIATYVAAQINSLDHTVSSIDKNMNTFEWRLGRLEQRFDKMEELRE